MSFIESVIGFLAPDECLICRREGALLCAMCLSQLPAARGYCFGCYKRLPQGVACTDCCRAAGCASIAAAAHYDGAARHLVANLKFRGNQAAARLMAACMAPDYEPAAGPVLVTNVPATTAHIRQRGFDQAELIARQTARNMRLPYARLLRRLGGSHQLGADRTVRHEQLKGVVIAQKARRIAGARILLIDDVLTTGASIQASAAALRRAGAAQVDALVFAQAIKNPPSRRV